MVKRGATSCSLGKSLLLVKCKNKKSSDDYGGQIKCYAQKGKKNKAEGKLMIKKNNHKVGEVLKNIRFLLQRCSSFIKKNKGLKRKKSFLSSSSSSTDDVISSYNEEAKLLLCQLEEEKKNADETPLKSTRSRKRRNKRKQQLQVEKVEELDNIIPVKEGDTVDIIPLLFPKHRDYLLKSHSSQLVKAKDLQGKLVVLFFADLYHSSWEQDAFCLIDVYNQIHHKSPFEVVFIPLTSPRDHEEDPQFDPHNAFSRIFSCMPWTAIPYSDSVSRQRLRATFGFDGTIYPDSSLIDPTGLVLAVYGNNLFSSFGARGFPYTDQRIKFLVAEERALLEHPSIYNLLASPEREYVISNDGRQVPILSLEDKVVALHFLEEGHSKHVRPYCYCSRDTSRDNLTVQLMTAYEQLKDKNFEVVLIYIHDSLNTQGRTNEDTFWKTFKTMPWLALPFKDPVIKKLRRICSYPLDFDGPAPDPGLVIVGPRGEFFEPYGADIFMNFGIPAYPFTRKRMVEVEVEKLEEVKPYMIWDSDTVLIRNAESEVKFCQVAGKRIILLIGNCWRENDVESLTNLKFEYDRRKGTDEEFEVIQLLDSDDLEHVADVPWLVQFLVDEDPSDLLEMLRDAFGNAQFVAFDLQGQVVRRAEFLEIDGGDDLKFPFYAGGLEKEIYNELYKLFHWNYWHKDYIFKI